MDELNSLLQNLHEILHWAKKKPYLPVWGELYCILRDIKRYAKKSKKNLFLYELDPNGSMVYDYEKNRFKAELDGLNILMTEYEYIDSLLGRRFSAKRPI